MSFWEIEQQQDERVTRPVRQLTLPLQDKTPEIKVSIPDTGPVALVPNVKNPILGYRGTRGSGRGSFQYSEYNLTEIGRIEDTDGYVRQAFGKKTALMFKEGWDFIGKNPRTIMYLKARLAQIAQASNIPTNTLFRNIGNNIVRKSNAFLVKIRNVDASGGKVRTPPGKTTSVKPVAAYFPLPAETMQFQLNGHLIVKWKQMSPGGDYIEYNPSDIVHIYHDRKDGFIFGTPTITPVVDDIRALRKIEENVELLVYQHLFPLFQYKVGTENAPAGMTETGEREIDIVKREIQYMPTEGGIVTPERHEIIAVGAEGRALRAEGYVEHFKKRVFSGLGVSAVDMGEGNTANRACYSEDTQTLTDSGFKYYWEITKQDKIATYNPETNQIEFQYPNGDILLYHHEGKMIEFKNRNVNVLVTPDHDMWMGRPRNDQELTWEKIHADSIDLQQFKFRTGGFLWNGLDPEDFQLPYVPYNCYSKVPNSGPFSRIPISDWLEFLGYYVSEGCLAKSKGKWAVTLSQNSVVNKEKTEKIRDCLSRLPFKFNEYTNPNDNTTRFWINCKSLYLYLEENCGDYSYLKHLPDEVLNYSIDALHIVFEAAMTGDGTSDLREGRTSRTYYSTSDKLLDQIQEITLKLGYRAHILPGSKCKRVCISFGQESNVVKDQIWVTDYNGMVYCFNVPNHLFITRRNGRIGIHGNTADNMSRNLVDGVKDLQQILEDAINQEIINELLLESNFGIDVLDDDNIVRIKFKEVDVDTQVKKETHAADLFAKDIIDHDEARRRIGSEPWVLPTMEEVQEEMDTPEQFPQWHRSRWKLFELPKLLIQAIDEPWSPAAKAAARDKSVPITPADNEKAATSEVDQEMAIEKEKTKAKIAVAKAKPRPVVRNGVLSNTFEQTKQDVVNRVSLEGRLDHEWVASLIRTQMGTTMRHLQIDQLTAFRQGYSMVGSIESEQFVNSISIVRSQFQQRSEHYIQRLIDNVVSLLRRNISSDDIVNKTRAVFDTLKYRTDFIEDVEIRKAATLGQAYALRDSGSEVEMTSRITNKNACSSCKAKDGYPISLDILHLDFLPPHHAGCNCNFKQLQSTPMSIQNTTETEDNSLGKGTRSTMGPQSKQTNYLKCVMKMVSKIRERHPEWSESQCQSEAEMTCIGNLVDENDKDDKLSNPPKDIEEK